MGESQHFQDLRTTPPTPAHILDRVPPSHDLDNARYARMHWNTPLSEEHAVLLLSRLDIRPGASLVDLGCGWGELSLRAVDTRA